MSSIAVVRVGDTDITGDLGSPVASKRSPQPQLADIADRVEAARAASGVRLAGALDAQMSSAQPYVVHRVLQEALTNARCHAPGEPADVLLLADDDVLPGAGDHADPRAFGLHRGQTWTGRDA